MKNEIYLFLIKQMFSLTCELHMRARMRARTHLCIVQSNEAIINLSGLQAVLYCNNIPLKLYINVPINSILYFLFLHVARFSIQTIMDTIT